MSSFDVKTVAALSRLELTPEEAAAYQKDLDAILVYVEKMAELDIADVEPTARAVEMDNVFREDVKGESIDRDIVMKNAPANVDDELFRVPVVIDEGGA
jgi:aspartyl-tRNA(Asn)/glutamyl-tRNA(Gln) amidotransferase subunit C